MAKFYAIKEGYDSNSEEKIENVIVKTWDECLKYVKGVKGAKYKSFKTLKEAEDFLNNSTDGLKNLIKSILKIAFIYM